MAKIKKVAMRCPDCENDIFCNEIVLEKACLYLEALCPECKISLRFSVDKILAQLMSLNFVDGTDNPN